MSRVLNPEEEENNERSSNSGENTPVAHPAHPYLLSPNEVGLFQTADTLELLPEVVHVKLDRYAELFHRPYRINHSEYDHVYITSDIHADLEKLDSMLMTAGLIRREPYSPELGLDPLVHIVCNTEWSVFRTVFIIIGDVVDGRRGSDALEIPDPKGNIELLLHAYLYNIRIKANALESEIRFTIGNHDFHTIIEDHTELRDFYSRHVHRTAQRYFVNRQGRRTCLMPFYQCCAYLMVTISDEIACVHGGFVGYTGAGFQDNAAFMVVAQQRIDAAGGDFYALTDPQLNALATPHDAANQRGGYEVSPLWSRWYAYTSEAGVCAHINRRDNPYKMIVVGHCQTGNSLLRSCCADGAGGHGNTILARPEYTRHNCHRGGCVLVGCRDPEGIPRLAFVDIAMSRAFNPALTLQVRAEVLHLQNNDALDDAQRFYNTIERLNVGMGGNPEVVWMAEAAVLSGGRRNRTRRGRNRNSKRLSKLRRRRTKILRRRSDKRSGDKRRG